MKKRVFTGLLDRHCGHIYEGDCLWVGMRRGDMGGWSKEKVVRAKRKFWQRLTAPSWSEWQLVNDHNERMDMQLDQELRELDQNRTGTPA